MKRSQQLSRIVNTMWLIGKTHSSYMQKYHIAVIPKMY
jgi:hypothetical protein